MNTAGLVHFKMSLFGDFGEEWSLMKIVGEPLRDETFEVNSFARTFA